MRGLDDLHLVTDLRGGRDPLPDVGAALACGLTCVQVRAKQLPDTALLELTKQVVALARLYGATVLVDDRVDIALAAGADGVHVGAQDLPVADVRRIAGPDLIVGATARTPEIALAAQRAGADYVGVGPVFPTRTKAGLPDPIGLAGIEAVAGAVGCLVIAIGGIALEHVPDLLTAGARGLAVVSALADDPAATSAFRAALTGHR